MKHHIKSKKKGIQIKISEIESKHEELLKSFELCQQGKCDCPTDEYKKLKNLNISSSKNQIILNLKAKEDQVFDTKEIKKCIDFTVRKLSKE